MRIIGTLSLLFIFVSCLEAERRRDIPYSSSKSVSFESTSVDSLVRSFARDYEDHLNRDFQLGSITLEFANSLGNPNAIGVCNTLTKEIKLLRSYWESASTSEKKWLVYHELGHCFLRRGHRSQALNNTAISIMFPSSDFIEFYNEFPDEYIEELMTFDETRVVDAIENYTRGGAQALSENEKPTVYFCDHPEHIE